MGKTVPPLSLTDVEDVDNENREMNEGNIAELHQFYSKHLDFPDHKDLLTLFSQVLLIQSHKHMLTYAERIIYFYFFHSCFVVVSCVSFNRWLVMVSL